MAHMPRDQVFISYSHKDRKWLDALLTHLQPYIRDDSISPWSDKDIQPGSKWFEQIRAELDRARVAVLLVTPNFLASDFVHKHELTPILTEAEKGGVTILWIHVRASSYQKTPIAEYEAVIDPAKPLAQMKAERDAALVQICTSITRTLGMKSPRSRIATKGVIGKIKPHDKNRNTDTDTLRQRKILRDVEHSAISGKLKKSLLVWILYGLLSEEYAIEATDRYNASRLINAVRLSDEYYVHIQKSRGMRDWQLDFWQMVCPILIGLSRSFKRSADVQALLIRVCNVLAGLLQLKIDWPAEADGRKTIESIYSDCLAAKNLRDDDVLRQLRGLNVVDPNQ